MESRDLLLIVFGALKNNQEFKELTEMIAAHIFNEEPKKRAPRKDIGAKRKAVTKGVLNQGMEV